MYKKYDLKYSYDGLEPYIDMRTVGIHYNNHYLNYLNKLNSLLEKTNYDFRYTKEELVDKIDIFNLNNRDEILFNLGGVLNHELYFDILNRDSIHVPTGKLKEKIDATYGSFDNFKNTFIKQASSLVGSGYTTLVVDKQNNLKIINTSNQDTAYSYGFIPIMTLDLWEHAYYLKYQNNRNLYMDNFFSIIDFEQVGKNYEKAIS